MPTINIPPLPEQDKDFTVSWVKWLRKFVDYVKALSDSIDNRIHNTLVGLQGGTTNEYYHLTADEYANLAGTGGGSHRYRGGVDTTDDIIIDDSNNGLVLKSPDGHYWRVQVTNAGALTQTDLGTTKP